MVQGYVQSTVAPILAETVSAHVERQVIKALTAPNQSALGVSLAALTSLLPERGLRTRRVLGAAFRVLRARPAGGLTQGLPTCLEPTRQGQIDKTAHKEGKPISLPPTLGHARSLHGGASVENRHVKYRRRDNAGKNVAARKVATSAKWDR